MRSHLGAFSGDLMEGELITEGFFSLFDSQYKVLLDVLGAVFDVILFCGVFAEIR